MSTQREITFGQAVKEAIAEEMRRDATVVLMGEDVAEAGTVFAVLQGLVEEFGTQRIIDSPISEAGITGLGVGMALTGTRPIIDIMFSDMTSLVMDQIANQAAKFHYMTGGQASVPMVLRTTIGGTRRSAAQHSQSLHAWMSHIPGIKVALPATPYDAKGLMKSAIRDNNPVAIFENKNLFATQGYVPTEEYLLPLGVADVKRKGEDITLVATSRCVLMALEAADQLAQIGISAEVIDPRTTTPLDKKTLIDSAKKTSRALVIDEGYNHFGATAEFAATIAHGAFYYLDAPVERLGGLDTPIPMSPTLEDEVYPTTERIVARVKSLCGRV